MSKRPLSHQATRDRIVAAAGPIFGRHGFQAATVRQITREAGVNLAAVNYHFRDKHELYAHVLAHAHQAAALTAVADAPASPRLRLHAFIRSFLAHLLDPERPEWQGQMIAREMIQPTPALDRFVAESIEPVRQRIYGIIRDLLGPRVPEEQVRRVCFSVLGQCLYYVHCREMIVRIFPQEHNAHRNVEALAKHIFQFSLAGLAALRREYSHPPKPAAKKSRKGSS